MVSTYGLAVETDRKGRESPTKLALPFTVGVRRGLHCLTVRQWGLFLLCRREGDVQKHRGYSYGRGETPAGRGNGRTPAGRRGEGGGGDPAGKGGGAPVGRGGRGGRGGKQMQGEGRLPAGRGETLGKG